MARTEGKTRDAVAAVHLLQRLGHHEAAAAVNAVLRSNDALRLTASRLWHDNRALRISKQDAAGK